MTTAETKTLEMSPPTPVERKVEPNHTEVFTSASEAISMYDRLGAELAKTYSGVKEGDVSTVDEFEEAYDKALTAAYEPSASKLSSDERRKAFDQFDYVLDSRDDTGEVGPTAQKSFNILLEMAWDIREDKGADDTIELIKTYAAKWNLSKDEIITVGELTKLDTDEFDLIQSQLINSSSSFTMVEEANRIIESRELPPTTKQEEKARQAEKEQLEKEEAWAEVSDKLISLYPELEDVDIVESDLNRALSLANHDRREMLAILRRVGGAKLEDVKDLIEPYSAENLEESQWILGFLLKSDLEFDILNTKETRSKKFIAKHDSQIDEELGKRLVEDRKGLLNGFTKLFGATLTDPNSGLHSEAFTVLQWVNRRASKNFSDNDAASIGAVTRKAFRNHYRVQLDGETKTVSSKFDTKKTKDDFYELWGEVLEKGGKEFKKVGHMVVRGATELYDEKIKPRIGK